MENKRKTCISKARKEIEINQLQISDLRSQINTVTSLVKSKEDEYHRGISEIYRSRNVETNDKIAELQRHHIIEKNELESTIEKLNAMTRDMEMEFRNTVDAERKKTKNLELEIE
ncbi:hypothetical protein HK096_001675, partial [Nowakowskiella sp. JEL0078]